MPRRIVRAWPSRKRISFVRQACKVEWSAWRHRVDGGAPRPARSAAAEGRRRSGGAVAAEEPVRSAVQVRGSAVEVGKGDVAGEAVR